MPINIDAIFSRGGKELIGLLDYGVRSVRPDLLFIFLVQEYRQMPTAAKACAIADSFCAPQAPARVSAVELLPPLNPQIEVAMRPLRANLAQIAAAQPPAPVPPRLLPPKFIFDALDLHLRKKSAALRSLKRRYRPERSPVENLPGGKMNAGQRFFVERVWEAVLRPRLVSAGFRRVSSVA